MRDESALPKHLSEETIATAEALESAQEVAPTPEEAAKERRDAITRLIVGIVLVVNFVAAAMGWTPLGDPETVAGTIWSALSAVVACWDLVYTWWWKNNNLTEAAQAGQKVADIIRAMGDE